MENIQPMIIAVGIFVGIAATYNGFVYLVIRNTIEISYKVGSVSKASKQA
jgi:hypothetical protein